MALGVYTLIALASGLFLVWKYPLADIVARAAAPTLFRRPLQYRSMWKSAALLRIAKGFNLPHMAKPSGGTETEAAPAALIQRAGAAPSEGGPDAAPLSEGGPDEAPARVEGAGGVDGRTPLPKLELGEEREREQPTAPHTVA